jgi:hypothetical protein
MRETHDENIDEHFYVDTNHKELSDLRFQEK